MADPTEIPHYVATERCYINGRLHEPGDLVVTHLPPGPHLAPHVGADGQEHPQAREAKDAAIKAMLPAPGDPRFIGQMIHANLNEGGATGVPQSAMGAPLTSDQVTAMIARSHAERDQAAADRAELEELRAERAAREQAQQAATAESERQRAASARK